MLRIVHVALQLETGGMERLLVEFARHADRERVSLRFVALAGGGAIAREIEALGWPVTVLDAPAGIRPSLLFRLAALFREWDTDVVHTHNTKPLLYAGPAARLASARAIHSRHGQRAGATARQDALFALAGRCADRIVGVSEDASRRSAQDGVRADSIRTIHNGIDVSRFAFHGPRAGGPALFVGRLSPEKDVPTLLRAMVRVVETFPEFRLEIAGSGACEDSLRDLADGLNLEKHVAFLGEVRDVPSLLARSSMLVLPSTTEGLSLCVLEAMASGLPIVATRVGGTPEAVRDGVDGVLVPAGDASALANAMIRMYGDELLAQRMGRSGRARVEECFDVRQMVRAYESLYFEVARRALKGVA